VEKHSKKSFDQETFYDLSKFYPFVIGKLGAEGVVRDAVQRNADESLLCVGELPVNSLVNIVTGDADSMIHAAQRARESALAGWKPTASPGVTLIMDCISRSICLGDRFPHELEVLVVPGNPQVGALTIGEVANNGQDYLEFYNKTAVVGILELR
jgi:hypothetical protein